MLLVSGVLAGACRSPASGPPTLQVAAAADLTGAFTELGTIFETQTGQHITFSFGSSGGLAQQLSQGAPFDLFAAASSAFVDQAVSAGACEKSSKVVYARGSLVLWSRNQPTLHALSDLARPELKHVAIANPEHAPYGRAAQEALMASNTWGLVQGKLVYAENVRQALQFAETGNADAAIVARSLVLGDGGGASLPIDPSLHRPIDQALVVCKNGKNIAAGRKFSELVRSAQGQSVLGRYGFSRSTEPGSK